MAPIHFGSLLFDYQPIDVLGPTDLVNSANKEYMQFISTISPVSEETIARAPEIIFHHIGLHPKQADFIRRHVAAGKTLFTNCTGSAVVASTGVLDGKKATINNVAYQLMKQVYPEVKWTNETKWVVDGNIWTAGGAVAGMDMFAHWLKENFGLDVLTHAASLLDFEPRDINGVLNVIPKRKRDCRYEPHYRYYGQGITSSPRCGVDGGILAGTTSALNPLSTVRFLSGLPQDWEKGPITDPSSTPGFGPPPSDNGHEFQASYVHDHDMCHSPLRL
ncbi:hypothetical protein ACJZ2D_004806 [Fusarium nematophilum]